MPLFAPRMLYLPTAAPAAAAGGVVPIRIPAQMPPMPSQRLSRAFLNAFGQPAGLWTPTTGGLTAYDYSGNQNSGTLNGSVSYTTGSGQFPAAWKFDGSTGYIDCANTNTSGFLTGDFTLTVSFISTLVNSQYHCICGRGNAAPPVEIKLYQWTNNTLVAYFGGTQLNSGFTVVANTRYICSVTLSGTACKIYVNGIQKASGTISRTTGSTSDFQIGKDPGGLDQYFQGSVDFCTVHSAALSAAQVSSLYSTLLGASGIPLFEPRTLWLPTGVGAAPTGNTYGFAGIGGVQGTGQVGFAA